MSVYGKVKMKVFAGVSKIKRIYLGGAKIYSAGNVVTYCVDEGVTYQEEVDSGATCLIPTTFIPLKDGWEFVGWRANSAATDVVLTTKTMEDAPITLYAVFSRVISVSYDGNGATGDAPATLTTQHYNNGNVSTPVVVLENNAFTKDGSTFACWKIGDAYYTEGAVVAITDNVTASAEWVQTVKEYGCTGTVETFVAPATGLYQLEAYGAQGNRGNVANAYAGGLGGYTKGELLLRKDEEVYVCVGDGGETGYGANYNGGGSAGVDSVGNYEGGSGGGATHFAKVKEVLAKLAGEVSKILLVAGGGGGGGLSGSGGTGGGTTGGDGKYNADKSTHPKAVGGSQTGEADFFGQGESSAVGNYSGGLSGGGGGGYYGGHIGESVLGASGGGGGSGYIGDVYNGTTQSGEHSGAGKALVTLKDAGAFEMSFRTAEGLNTSDSTRYYMTYDTYGNGWRVSEQTTANAISKNAMRVFNPDSKDCFFRTMTAGYTYVFDVTAPATGCYRINANVVRAVSGGTADIFVNGDLVGTIETYGTSETRETQAVKNGNTEVVVNLIGGEYANEIKIAPHKKSDTRENKVSLASFTFTVANGGE